jgi:probable HAF family extracellular repeat protein
MLFTSLYRSPRPTAPRPAGRSARPKSPHLRPDLEVLEDRTVPSYLFQTIDPPSAGQAFFQGSFATGINSSGEIVGSYTDANQVTHGYLLSGGQYTTLDDPNAGGTTTARGINDRGQIVGTYFGNLGTGLHGFVLDHGQYTTIDDPDAIPGSTQAGGINASGTIVGTYLDHNVVVHGYVLSHGQCTTLDDPDAGTGVVQGTYALGINASGQIVGFYVDANYAFHGYVLSGGKYTTIDAPDAAPEFFQGTTASGINDRGQIVGGYTDANFVNHGFLLSDGRYTVLDDPNASDTGFFMPGTVASGINASGQIVGAYTDANSVNHGFLAAPTHDNSPSAMHRNSGAAAGRGGMGFHESALFSTAMLTNARLPRAPFIIELDGAVANSDPGLGRIETGDTAVATIWLSTASGNRAHGAQAGSPPQDLVSRWHVVLQRGVKPISLTGNDLFSDKDDAFTVILTT